MYSLTSKHEDGVTIVVWVQGVLSSLRFCSLCLSCLSACYLANHFTDMKTEGTQESLPPSSLSASLTTVGNLSYLTSSCFLGLV